MAGAVEPGLYGPIGDLPGGDALAAIDVFRGVRRDTTGGHDALSGRPIALGGGEMGEVVQVEHLLRMAASGRDQMTHRSQWRESVLLRAATWTSGTLSCCA